MAKYFKIHLIFAALMMALLSLSACEKKAQPTEADQLENIQSKIDHQLYDESIEELEQILSKDPENKRARTILASVYVHRAGISVREFFILESLFRDEAAPVKPLINIDVFEKLELKKDSQFQKALEFLKKVNTIVSDSQKISEKFQKIPLLENQQAVDIYRALQELEKIQGAPAGISLYRGTIKLIYFKYIWETNQLLSIGSGKMCSSSMKKLNSQLEILKNFTVGMVQDIAVGVPKSEVEFRKKAASLHGSISKAQSLVANLGSAQMTLTEVINQVVQTTDIKGFKCSF